MVEKDKSKHPPSQLQEDLKSPVVDLDFSCAKGLATLLLSPTLDSLVRVSRRAGEPRTRTGTTRKEARINIKSKSSINQGCHPQPSHPDRNNKNAPSGQTQTMITSIQLLGPPLPSQQVQVLFTLFSKCFSSFLHSTCSLSV